MNEPTSDSRLPDSFPAQSSESFEMVHTTGKGYSQTVGKLKQGAGLLYTNSDIFGRNKNEAMRLDRMERSDKNSSPFEPMTMSNRTMQQAKKNFSKLSRARRAIA